MGGAREGTGDGNNVMPMPPVRLVISSNTPSDRAVGEGSSSLVCVGTFL